MPPSLLGTSQVATQALLLLHLLKTCTLDTGEEANKGNPNYVRPTRQSHILLSLQSSRGGVLLAF